MSRVIAQIGPADHGKHMSLEDFDHAEGAEGHLYELAKGVIIVTDVPDYAHLAQLEEIREVLYAYRRQHRGRIHTMAAGSDSKILLSSDQSERHPDLSMYFSAPPERGQRGPEFWSTWVPDIAIEIVSKSSRRRDYVEKREEYLGFGVREYWIIDAEKEQMLALRRSRKQWVEQVVGSDQIYRTRLLPDLESAMKPIFDAARDAG